MSGQMLPRFHLALTIRLAVLFAVCCLPAAGRAQGTTIITHGYQVDGTFPDWPLAMAAAIADRATGVNPATVLRYQPDTGEWVTISGSEDPGEEIVLVFDWALDSAWLPGLNDRLGTARAAADALYAALRDPDLPGGLTGASVLDAPGGGVRALHFIGHSRGAVVNSEAVRRLVLAGYSVDQVTTLDPHPIDGPDPDLLDPQPETWVGVTWADNYWRADGCNFDSGCTGFDFDGQPVLGADNVSLAFLDALGPGDSRLDSCTLEHTLTHVWYHGTIDLAAADDGECTIDRPDWYTGTGDGEGFYFTLVGGGAADRPCGVLGGCTDAGRAIPPPAPVLINGGFEFGEGEPAGWMWHGGGGSGAILSAGGETFLELDSAAPDRTHNRFYLPADAESLRYDYRIITPDSLQENVLDVALVAADGTVYDLDELDLFPSATGWVSDRTVALPAALPTGATFTLQLALTGGTMLAATVDVDDITFLTPEPPFRRGDCNEDGSFDIADPIAHLNTLFLSAPPAYCDDACDVNDDGTLDIADPIYALDALFTSGSLPPAPFPGCGPDPTPDAVTCVSYACP